MRSVKQIAADEVRFMWYPIALGLSMSALGIVAALRGDTNLAHTMFGGSVVWHLMELAALFSYRADIKRWALQYRGRY